MADPLWLQTANEYQAELDRRFRRDAAALEREWERAGKKLRAEMEALARHLSRMDPAQVTEGMLRRLAQYQAMLAAMESELREVARQAEPSFEEQAATAAAIGLLFGAAILMAVRRQRPKPLTGAALRQAIAERALENIISTGRAGKPLRQLLKVHSGRSAVAVRTVLLQGIRGGASPERIATNMVRSGFGSSYQQALLISRDQQSRIFREATRQSFIEAGIRQYMRLAKHDPNTCLACLALDGTIYSVDEFIETHPQCRCKMVPVINGYAIAGRRSGQEYFESLSSQSQKRILGPGRYDAWQAGKFKFADLVTTGRNPTWGPTARVTNLRDLI